MRARARRESNNRVSMEIKMKRENAVTAEPSDNIQRRYLSNCANDSGYFAE